MNYIEKNQDILQALQLANQGHLKQSNRRLIELLELHPDNNFLLINLALLNVHIKDFNAVEDFLSRFINNREDQFEDFYFKATQILSDISQFQLAIQCAEQLVSLFPDLMAAKVLLADTCYYSRDIDKAITVAESILKKEPHKVVTKVFLGNAYSGRGRFEEAETLFTESLALSPYDSFACHGLSKCRSFKQDAEKFLPLFEKALAGNQQVEERSRILFAMAKLLNDTQDYDNAWQKAEEANCLQASLVPFNEAQYVAYIDELIAEFSQLEYPKSDESLSSPILIVGMPRSGTTLTEQILSNALSIYPGGEKQGIDYAILQTIGTRDLLQSVPTLEKNHFSLLAQEYQQYFSRFANYNNGTIVDKVPSNYLFLGLFKKMFPNIKILNLQRNPLDVTASIFFENFTYKLNYTNRVKDIICVYQQYRRLMDFWQQLFQDNILTIQYEHMVEDYESHKKKIIEFCGLELGDNKSYQESSNLVETPSSWQVRQGIYQSSKNRWRRYQKYLEPYYEQVKSFIP